MEHGLLSFHTPCHPQYVVKGLLGEGVEDNPDSDPLTVPSDSSRENPKRIGCLSADTTTKSITDLHPTVSWCPLMEILRFQHGVMEKL